MKSILKYLWLRLTRKTFFVSGTFPLKGERKWFRLIYSPESNYVNEKEIQEIFEKETQEKLDYFVITFYKRVSIKEQKNF